MDFVKPQDSSDTRSYVVKKAENFFPYLRKIVEVNTVLGVNYYVYEGDIILPEQVSSLAKEYEIKTCFLGFSNTTVDLLKQHIGNHQWLDELSKEKLHQLPQRIMEDSKYIEEGCKKYGFKYLDLSKDYDKQHELAYSYLVTE